MIGATSRVKLGVAAAALGPALPRDAASAASGIARDSSAAVRIAILAPLRMPGVICTPKLTKHVAHLAHGAACTECLAYGGKEVRVALGHALHLCESLGGTCRIACGADCSRPLALAALDLRIDVQQLDVLRRVLGEPVHPDDDALSRLDLRLVAKRGRLDLPLHEPLLDGRYGSAQVVDSPDQLSGALLELRGECLD